MGFWWLGEEEESKPVHGIGLGTWPQKKLEKLSAAPDELDHACQEARDFASPFRVSYDMFMFIMGATKPNVFSMYPRRRWLCLLGSRAKIYTLQRRNSRSVGDSAFLGSRAKIYTLQRKKSRFVGESAFQTYFGRAPLLVGKTA